MDIRTLLICFLTVHGCTAIALLLISLRERETGSLRWLAGAFAASTLGTALGAARATIPGDWSIVAGNGLIMVGYLLLHQAVAAFLGVSGRQLRVGLPLLALYLVGAAYLTFAVNDAQPRIVFFSVLIAVQAGRSALLLLRARAAGDERVAMLSVGGMLAALAALNLLRALLTSEAGAPADFLRPDAVQAGSLLAILVTTLLIGFGFFWMTSARLRVALHQQANHDDLTGLLNRRGFMSRAAEYRRAAEAEGRRLLLVFADLDGLKQVNDSGGHAAGDRLLVDAAAILLESLPPSASLARIGGDEFSALLTLAPGDDAETHLARIADGVAARNARAEGAAVGISAAGILVEPDESESLEELLAAVDDLMYLTKRAGGAPPPAAHDLTLPAGGLKRIHVSRQMVQRFQETGADEPAWMVRTPDGVYRCRGWTMAGDLVGVQSLTEPVLGGKARLWLETREAIRMTEPVLLDPRASEVEQGEA